MLLGVLLLDALPLRRVEVFEAFAAKEVLDIPCKEGMSIVLDTKHRHRSPHVIFWPPVVDPLYTFAEIHSAKRSRRLF
jgi:hypothetical protein